MDKKIIKLNESQLREIITESVKKTLNEWYLDIDDGMERINMTPGWDKFKRKVINMRYPIEPDGTYIILFPNKTVHVLDSKGEDDFILLRKALNTKMLYKVIKGPFNDYSEAFNWLETNRKDLIPYVRGNYPANYEGKGYLIPYEYSLDLNPARNNEGPRTSKIRRGTLVPLESLTGYETDDESQNDKQVSLNESQLRDMIAESVKKELSEGFFKNIFKPKNKIEPEQEGWYIYANSSRSLVDVVKANDPNINRNYMHKLPGGPFAEYDEAWDYYHNVLEKKQEYSYNTELDVKKCLLNAAKSAIKTIIKPQLANIVQTGQFKDFNVSKREIAQIMKKSFKDTEAGGKRIIQYLKTGKEPYVEDAINVALKQIKNKIRRAQY